MPDPCDTLETGVVDFFDRAAEAGKNVRPLESMKEQSVE
jgi:hypothetical protein